MKLSDFVFKHLAEKNVRDVFMLSGGGCMHLVNSLGLNPDINYTCCLFEQAVALSANAYAQYKNELGVCLVTTGPGGTNAITGVAEAWTDSIPLLVISGQVKTSDLSRKRVRTLGFQELDIVSVVKPITKYAVTIESPEDILYELDKCIHVSLSGRPGPVWLDIPLDIQSSIIDEKKLKKYNANEKLYTNGFNNNVSIHYTKSIEDYRKTIIEIFKCISEASRPVILAGYGIKLSNCEKSFYSLIEKLGIPVLTTWKAMDLLSDDFPLYYGRPGNIGQRSANFIQQNCDLFISIGARLDFGQIGYDGNQFARSAKKIIVDIDNSELEKFKFNIDFKINLDASDFIEGLLAVLDENQIDKTSYNKWIKYCDRMKSLYPVITKEHINVKDGTSTYYLMKLLSEKTDDSFAFAPGNSGACSEIFSQAYSVQTGQRVVSSNTLGSMGTGLPESIGVAIASKKKTICINGDGGFQMNIQDLETVHRLKLPIKFFVLNNKGYGSIKNSQNNYFNGFYVGAEAGSGVTIPEIERIAYAYKIKYICFHDNKEMEERIDEILDNDDPIICELLVSPYEYTFPRSQSEVLPNGKMISKPQEDLYPFLSREEFSSNMII